MVGVEICGGQRYVFIVWPALSRAFASNDSKCRASRDPPNEKKRYLFFHLRLRRVFCPTVRNCTNGGHYLTWPVAILAGTLHGFLVPLAISLKFGAVVTRMIALSTRRVCRSFIPIEI